MMKKALAIAILAVAACGEGDDDDGGGTTTTGDDPGIEDIVENPEGVQERTEARYERYTQCAIKYGKDNCPTPGETDAYDHEDWAERLALED
jgi:hypothetical protein